MWVVVVVMSGPPPRAGLIINTAPTFVTSVATTGSGLAVGGGSLARSIAMHTASEELGKLPRVHLRFGAATTDIFVYVIALLRLKRRIRALAAGKLRPWNCSTVCQQLPRMFITRDAQ